ncbi:MAG: Uma2 family endonuclease [Blastocatellia bacterium]
MSANLKRRYSINEYFEIEKSTDYKNEYFYGEIFAMTGASRNHCHIAGGIYSQLYQQLRASRCEPFMSEMRTRIHNQVYRYPDLVVACEPRFEVITGLQTLVNPILAVEVLSRSTATFDQDGKFQEYQQIESLRYYLLVSQNQVLATLFTKQLDNTWNSESFDSLESSIELPTINCRLAMAEIYFNVAF